MKRYCTLRLICISMEYEWNCKRN